MTIEETSAQIGLSFDANRDLIAAFPTPIINTRLLGAAMLNTELRRIILNREAESAGRNRSNIGGWHSTEDFFSWPEPVARQVAYGADALVRRITGLAVGREPWKGKIAYEAWANVSRRGNYNRMHNHPGAHWSGVYYVDTGESDLPDGDSGKIEFQDPRAFAQMIVTPGTPFGRSFKIRPTPGQILVFPSFLNHFVHPLQNDGVRISIAFNAILKQPDPEQTY